MSRLDDGKFDALRSQLRAASSGISDDQLLTLADDLHDVLRGRRRDGSHSFARESTFGDIVFEQRAEIAGLSDEVWG